MQKSFTVRHRHNECVAIRTRCTRITPRGRRVTPHASGLRDKVVNGELTEWPQLTGDKVQRLLQTITTGIFHPDFLLELHRIKWEVIYSTIQIRLFTVTQSILGNIFSKQHSSLLFYIMTYVFMYSILKMKMTSMCCCGTLAIACFLNVRLIMVFRKSHCCAFPQTIYFIVKETLTCMAHPIWCK